MPPGGARRVFGRIPAVDKKRYQAEVVLLVCTRKDGICGKKGTRLRARLNEAAEAQGLKKQIRVLPTGCLDACGCGPAVLDSASQTLYVEVGKDDAADIVRKTARRHGLKP